MRKLFAFFIIYIQCQCFSAAPIPADFRLWGSSDDNGDSTWNRHVTNMANDMTSGLQSSWSKLKRMTEEASPLKAINESMFSPIVQFFHRQSERLARSVRSLRSSQPSPNNLIQHTDTPKQTKDSKNVKPFLDRPQNIKYDEKTYEKTRYFTELSNPEEPSNGILGEAEPQRLVVPLEYQILNLIETEEDNASKLSNQLVSEPERPTERDIPTSPPHVVLKKSAVKKELASSFPFDNLLASLGSEENSIDELLLGESPDTDSVEKNAPCSSCSDINAKIQIPSTDSMEKAENDIAVLQKLTSVLKGDSFYLLRGPYMWVNGTIQPCNMTRAMQPGVAMVPINPTSLESLQAKTKVVFPHAELQKEIDVIQGFLQEIAI